MSVLDLKGQFRLRVEICIGTIIDVHKQIKNQFKNDDFISQFEKLRRFIENIDMKGVSEQDIRMVEKATNDLLCEFRPLFKKDEQNRVYGETVH